MRFIHPLFMLGFLACLYQQRVLGLTILGLKGNAPEFSDRGSMLEKHVSWAYGLLAYIILGMIGGIAITLRVLNAPEAFQHTYGHGFFGILALTGLICAYFLGVSIKKVVKPKIRERFRNFHTNIFYIIALFAGLSLISGAGVLIFGISIN
ncbi:MAG: hypothetical protein HQM09_10680 [Candidatus Riflebacteria bacterium]|nr:hypothetical protein [Candidatus Riflebacteria bacterium]